jgi:hypothetical protein
MVPVLVCLIPVILLLESTTAYGIGWLL